MLLRNGTSANRSILATANYAVLDLASADQRSTADEHVRMAEDSIERGSRDNLDITPSKMGQGRELVAKDRAAEGASGGAGGARGGRQGAGGAAALSRTSRSTRTPRRCRPRQRGVDPEVLGDQKASRIAIRGLHHPILRIDSALPAAEHVGVRPG